MGAPQGRASIELSGAFPYTQACSGGESAIAALTCVLHHHIGEESVFEKGLGLTSSRAAFERHLDWFAQRYTFVSLGDVLSGNLPANALLMTFDDAWYSVLEAARELLAPRGIPGVFFINPSMLEDGAMSLDSALAWAVNTQGIARVCQLIGVPARQSVHEVIIRDMALLGASKRQEVLAQLIGEFGPRAPAAEGRSQGACRARHRDRQSHQHPCPLPQPVA